MPNRTEACPAKAALRNATGRLPLLRLFSTLLIDSRTGVLSCNRFVFEFQGRLRHGPHS